MTEQPDNPSPRLKPDATPKKLWVEPEIDITPATETRGATPNPFSVDGVTSTS